MCIVIPELLSSRVCGILVPRPSRHGGETGAAHPTCKLGMHLKHMIPKVSFRAKGPV